MQKLFCLMALLQIGFVFAQTSEKYNSVYASFYRAEDFYLKEQYGAAREECRSFQIAFNQPNDPKYIQARYYEGLAALELYQTDAVTLLEAFNRDYPESIYRKNIYFRLGRFYYQKKDYPQTLKWLNLLTAADMDSTDIDEFYFKKGFAYYETGEFDKAKKTFFEVKESTTQYGAPALYYYSHLQYLDGSNQVALEGFLKLKEDPNYAAIVPTYIAHIYYQQGKYDEVIAYAQGGSAMLGNERLMSILFGDSYYRTGKYEEALPYLEKHNKLTETSRENDYQLGYTYFQTKRYDKAIAYFAKVTQEEDSLGQIAFYQIGESYIKMDSKMAARSAFKRAAEMSFDDKIAEDAAYQHAVLSYKLDLNPYDEALVAFENYLAKYPNSKRRTEVYQYMVNVYTSTNNYGKALESLDNLKNKDIRLRSAYQLIAFNAGVEMYQKKEYAKSIQLFEKVEKYPIDQNLSAQAAFWTADAFYQMEEYRKAIQNYRVFLNSPTTGLVNLRGDAYYNIGYANLELKDTLQAIESFKLFTQQGQTSGKKKLADAHMRIGDGYYSLRQNELAVESYLQVINLKSGYEDQALHYLGKTYGFMSKRLDDKIAAHQQILTKYPKSKYVQMAVQELAISYKLKGEYSQSIKYFETIIAEYPNSDQVKFAKIEIADLYYKKTEYLKSEAKYREVLENYGGERSVCEVCSKNLIALYATMREPERLQKMINDFPCLNLNSDDQENLYYTPGFELYKDSNYVEAIPQIQKYLNQYPKGKYVVEMSAFLGTCYMETKDTVSAIAAYQKVLDAPTNGYTEYCAQLIAKYHYNGGRYAEALPAYYRLEAISSKPEVIYNAQLGIMRSSFLLEKHLEASSYASKVLANTQITNTVRLEAQYAKGLSSYQQKEYAEALIALEFVVKNTTTVWGAESKYLMADIAFKQSEFDKTDKHVRELLKMKPSYNYWVAKGLLLQSNVLIQKQDYFQAEQTVQSVLDHYPIKDDGILQEAQQIMDELNQIKNQPKIIEPETQPIIDINGK